MATRERRIDHADRYLRRVLPALGGELRENRMQAGLSLARVAELAGCSRSHLARVENGLDAAVRVRDLARAAAIVGLDLSVKLYPSGPPLRDQAHLVLLDLLRREIASTLVWRTEVPLPLAGDRRAFDAMILGAGDPIAVEAETRLRDLQAFERQLTLKLRDGQVHRAILLVKRSQGNREVLASAPAAFWQMFPIPSARALNALRVGRDPRGSAVIVR